MNASRNMQNGQMSFRFNSLVQSKIRVVFPLILTKEYNVSKTKTSKQEVYIRSGGNSPAF